MPQHLLGVDSGGTFTDFVYLTDGEFRVHKVLSTPDAPDIAVSRGIAALGLDALVATGRLQVIHGTTVATNAVLQGKGVRTAYITNSGLSDVPLIGRQVRSRLYDLRPGKPTPPIEESMLFEIDARLAADGEVVTPMDQLMLDSLKESVVLHRPAAIAINLLFSFINDEHERQVEALFEQPHDGSSYFISRSSFVLPEYREYERGIATWVNAWIGPLIERYMISVKDMLAPSSVSIMQSSGMTISADQASRRAVNLLLSGPAGGLAAAGMFQPSNVMTFDMGGTSTDVALMADGIRLTSESTVADLPIAVPMADIHTIGAGGGSIASVDAGGLLRVGPQSAGAQPGPACYGLGGDLPTVTDANLLLGRLRPDAFLGGEMSLSEDRAEGALLPLAKSLSITVEEAALGILEVANEHMTQALRHISVQRGFDPGDFTLVCFGGAGGLHLCALAEAMNMHRAMVPVMSGVLSALGMLATNPGRELTRTHRSRLELLASQELEGHFIALERQGLEEMQNEGVTGMDRRRSLDLRYLGQTFTINVPFSDIPKCEEHFHESHERQYGHRLDKPVELVNVRVHLEARRPQLTIPRLDNSVPGVAVDSVDLRSVGSSVPVYLRGSLTSGQQLHGPALIIDTHATSLVLAGWNMRVDEFGNLQLEQSRG